MLFKTMIFCFSTFIVDKLQKCTAKFLKDSIELHFILRMYNVIFLEMLSIGLILGVIWWIWYEMDTYKRRKQSIELVKSQHTVESSVTAQRSNGNRSFLGVTHVPRGEFIENPEMLHYTFMCSWTAYFTAHKKKS